MKGIILLALFALTSIAHAQFITARATHSTGIISDNLISSDLSKSLGAEIYFSKPLEKIPLNYNLGINYQYTDGMNAAYVLTGASFVVVTPSGFSATNVESVSYTSSHWLNYADLNLYNGVQMRDSTINYALAAEIGYNVGFVLGKYFFIHSGFGGRYNYYPANKDTEFEYNSVDIMLKFGVLWKFNTRKYKP